MFAQLNWQDLAVGLGLSIVVALVVAPGSACRPPRVQGGERRDRRYLIS
jgi:hypothetical protein